MKPTFVGFGPTTAFAVIFWIKDDDIVSKTVCYSKDDVQDRMEKRNTLGSLYNSFDGFKKDIVEERSLLCIVESEFIRINYMYPC